MGKTIIKYGIISGVLQALLLIGSTFLLNRIGYTYAEGISYIGIVVAFLPIFMGVIRYRDSIGEGAISFGKGAAISVCAGLISSLFYVGSWAYLYYSMPEIMDKIAAFSVQQMKNATRPQKEIDDMLAQIKDAKEMLQNHPLIPAAYKYLNTVPGTVVFSMIIGLLARKKKPGLPLAQSGNGLLN